MNIYKPHRVVLQILTLQLVLTAGALGQQAPTPEIAEQAQRWLEAFNSGDYATMEKFQGVTADSDAAAHNDVLHQYEIYRMTGGLESTGMEQANPKLLWINGRERVDGTRVNLVLDVSSTPFHLEGVRLVRSPEESATRAALSETEVIADFDIAATRLAEADAFSGTTLIAKNGKVLYAKAWGLADKTTGAPNKLDTKLNLASCGKMFTAIAILQLAEAGKLSLDDTVGKLLPDYNNKDVREKVTVQMLLSHTSGLGDMFGKEFDERRMELRSVADFVSLFETKPLRFEPGTRWGYSNAGFCLLGAIIEKVSGEDYYAYVLKHIFEPAGMKNTGAFETDRPQENLAIGYTTQGATTPEQIRDRLPNTDLHNVKGSPAGGNYSTAEDLANFADALLNYRLLSKKYTRLAFTQQPKTDSYGLGFGVEYVNDHAIVGHSGGFPGISTSVLMYPDDGYVVIVLSNYDRIAGKLASRMREWIVAQPTGAAKNNAE